MRGAISTAGCECRLRAAAGVVVELDFQSDEERQWWGGLWADRVRQSEYARQSLEYGLTSPQELEGLAAAFLQWAADPEALFVVVNGEVIATKPVG